MGNILPFPHIPGAENRVTISLSYKPENGVVSVIRTAYPERCTAEAKAKELEYINRFYTESIGAKEKKASTRKKKNWRGLMYDFGVPAVLILNWAGLIALIFFSE